MGKREGCSPPGPFCVGEMEAVFLRVLLLVLVVALSASASQKTTDTEKALQPELAGTDSHPPSTLVQTSDDSGGMALGACGACCVWCSMNAQNLIQAQNDSGGPID